MEVSALLEVGSVGDLVNPGAPSRRAGGSIIRRHLANDPAISE